MRKMSRSPMRTVSTSPPVGSKMRMRGGGAAGAEVMLIMSGSLFPEIIRKFGLDLTFGRKGSEMGM